jgi:Protein of unknown function DUF45
MYSFPRCTGANDNLVAFRRGQVLSQPGSSPRLLGVTVRRFFVQRMKTKWGSCNHRAGSIRLNTDLARKPRECLEYIVVHETVHLLEPTHNARFVALMDQFMPKWQSHRDALNRLPVRHESWDCRRNICWRRTEPTRPEGLRRK